MELKIYNPTAENIIKAIDWNFEDLKAEITVKAQEYKGLVYTDENIKEAKSDRAMLNKFNKALDDKRKEVKKMILEPYTNFECQVKELMSIISDANSSIDTQIKDYEQKKHEEKYEKVKEIYDKTFENSEVKDIVTWERAFKESYLNVSTTPKTIINEMADLRDSVRHDLEIINDDASGYQFEMKNAYLKKFDMTDAVAAKNRCEENARKKAEYEARKKADDEARMEREKAEAEKMANAGSIVNADKIPDTGVYKEQAGKLSKTAEPAEEYITIDFRVTGTLMQINALKEFLKNSNIKYGPVQ